VTGPAVDFSTLPLSPPVLANLQQLGYLQMTPIQAASLPVALAGTDLIAQAKTGSGKTAAFALPLLARLDARRFDVQALVLCPTRELADQVTAEVRRLARAEENIKVVTLCGGVALRGQLSSLGHGAHIVVGTPGRVLDHLERGSLQLDALSTLVLDEADRMLDMGFLDDIATVVRQCPKERQTLLFSATYPEGIAKLAAQFMKNPQQIAVAAQHEEGQIRQRWYEVQDSERLHAVGRARSPSATPSSSAATWRRCCRPRASAHSPCSASSSSVSATRCWCSSPIAAARCWSPPTWPRGDWTSHSSKP
jgi:ATP-independent RNA helicase DbpA